MLRRWKAVFGVGAALLMLQGCGVSMFGGEPAPARVAEATPAPAANAEPEKKEPPQGLALYDGDLDGVITKDELEKSLVNQFKKDDTDASGEISPSELRVVNDRIMQEPDATPVIDWNADGKIVMQEYASQWRTMFERADVNQDGTVDQTELAGRARERRVRPLPSPEFGKYKGKI